MGYLNIGKHRTTIAPAGDALGSVAVTYHRTKVVTFNASQIVLDSGGYRTLTTKKRMNQVSWTHDLGYMVYQRNFDWYVSWRGEELPFCDGMILTR